MSPFRVFTNADHLAHDRLAPLDRHGDDLAWCRCGGWRDLVLDLYSGQLELMQAACYGPK